MIIIKLYLIIGLLIAAYGIYHFSKEDEFKNYSTLAVVLSILFVVVAWPYPIWQNLRDANQDSTDSEKTES